MIKFFNFFRNKLVKGFPPCPDCPDDDDDCDNPCGCDDDGDQDCGDGGGGPAASEIQRGTIEDEVSDFLAVGAAPQPSWDNTTKELAKCVANPQKPKKCPSCSGSGGGHNGPGTGAQFCVDGRY